MALLAGVALAVMPVMHPRMERLPVGAVKGQGTVLRTPDRQVRLSEPGFFGRRWGAMTPFRILMGHAVYGLVLALVYNAFA